MTTRDENVNRRDLASALGLAVGAFALTQCTVQRDGPTATSHAALKGTNCVWFDTIAGATASLRTTAGDSDDQVAVAEGYSAAGDGGGGIFWWDKSGGTDDGGTVIVAGGAGVGATGPCWRRIHDGRLNVRWFGATGDGTTDDQPAFQHALDAAGSSPPNAFREVVVPPGTYALSFTLKLPSGVWLRGANYDGSATSLSFTAPPSDFAPWGDGLLIDGFNRVSNLAIFNNNPSNTTGYGIHCKGKVTIDGCALDGWSQQLVFDGAETSECRDCTFSTRSLSSGVGPSDKNVHIRFAAPHGRLNSVAGGTNTTRVSNCNFFGNGGIFILHEDGLAYECDFINLELSNTDGSTPASIGVFTIVNAQQVHYSHVTTGDGADVPIFVVGGGTNTLAANGLTIDDCWIALPPTQPFLWVQYPCEAWGVYINHNVFDNTGRPAGIIKLDYYLVHWEIAHNYYSGPTTLFDGANYVDPSGRLCEPGHPNGALGMGTASPMAAVAINESLGAPSTKAIRVFDPANTTDNGNHWWLGTGGKSKQWKRFSSGYNFDIPNGETVYQEYFNTVAGSTIAQPFASATDYPMMSGLHASDFNLIVYEVEAIGNAYGGGRYYHRKQRIAVTQYGGAPVQVTSFPAYPDVFENAVGTGWATSAANMSVSGGQVVLTVAANSIDSIAWYVQVRIISRANYGATLP